MNARTVATLVIGLSAALFITWAYFSLRLERRSIEKEWCETGTGFRYPEWLIHSVTLITGFYIVYYLGWRLTTLNPQAAWLSWGLWIAEFYGFLTFLLFTFMTWRPVYKTATRPPPGLSVDILVPTRGEPLDVLRATIVGCVAVTYPNRTYILDDSNRPEVENLARSLGCRYMARPTHEGGKAGNLNYALKQTSGELVAVLDADNVPFPNFLDKTLGFFGDRAVAAVQGPQLFYNLDSFQHERCGWHEQRLFYNLIMPCKNNTRSAFWCGSPSVLRRSALQKIGGVASETVTEDLHTTMRFVEKGYYVLFTEQALASGVAPGSVEAYLGQRFRWGQGSMQVLRGKDSPFRARGLSLGQRLNFIASTVTYFDGLQQVVLLAVPVITLFTGWLPVKTVSVELMARLIPYLALIMLAQALTGRGSYNFWYVNRYSLLRSFTYVAVLPALVTGKARRFAVTTKDAGGKWSTKLMAPHLVAAVLSVLAITVGLVHFYWPQWYRMDPVGLGFAILWTVVGVVLTGEAMKRLLTGSRRFRYRFPLASDIEWRRPGEIRWKPGRTLDLSSTGLGSDTMEPGCQQESLWNWSYTPRFP